MTRNLDWKWIGIGVLIMIALNLAAGFITALFSGRRFKKRPRSRTLR